MPGSPVIVEANTPEYRHWGTRFTIYTGLPGVVGWNWHERQQRTITPDTWVYERIDEVNSFYQTEPTWQSRRIPQTLQRAVHHRRPDGARWYGRGRLAKFEQQNGKLWDKVYHEGETVIYKVR